MAGKEIEVILDWLIKQKKTSGRSENFTFHLPLSIKFRLLCQKASKQSGKNIYLTTLPSVQVPPSGSAGSAVAATSIVVGLVASQMIAENSPSAV